MTSALYFPYIRVPQNEWFARALLYWDSVGAIVPMNYWRDPEQLGPYMVALIREGLVEPIAPVAFVGQAANFSSKFIEYLDRNHSHRLRRDHVKDRWPRIHIEKLGDVADELERIGLARRATGFWYQVEPNTAQEFMAYLAGVVSTCSNGQFVPVTDHPDYLKQFQDGRQEADGARSILLEGILIGPSADISAYELRRFKDQHGAQLRAFRRRVEYEVDNLLTIGDREVRDLRVTQLSRTLKDEIAEIAAELGQPRYGGLLGFGSLCTLGAIGAAGTADLLAGTGLDMRPEYLGSWRSCMACEGARERRHLCTQPWRASFPTRLDAVVGYSASARLSPCRRTDMRLGRVFTKYLRVAMLPLRQAPLCADRREADFCG
jgi:hypothetical protein